MITKDGMEVYLKPVRGDGSIEGHLRLPEIELKPDNDYGGRYMNCFVPITDQLLQLVIRFPENFPMYSASAIHIGVAVTGADGKPSAIHWFILQRSWIPGQQQEWSMPHRGYLKMINVPEDEFTMSCEKSTQSLNTAKNYDDALNPGTITVIIQRGNTKWADEDVALDEPTLYGPGNPADKRHFLPKSFQHLSNKGSEKFRFEFRPRSRQRLVEIENLILQESGKPALSEVQIADDNRYDMQPDNDYVREKFRTAKIRTQMRKDFEKNGKLPDVIADPPVARPIRLRLKRSKPQTCDCPKELHARQRRNKNTVHEMRNGDVPGSDVEHTGMSATEPTKAKTKLKRSTAQKEDTALAKKTVETEAKLCQSCHKFKPPGKGRKLAWRQRKGRWMSVNQDAPDEEPPDPVSENQDDEELPIIPDMQLQDALSGEQRDETTAPSNEAGSESTLPCSAATVQDPENLNTNIDIVQEPEQHATGLEAIEHSSTNQPSPTATLDSYAAGRDDGCLAQQQGPESGQDATNSESNMPIDLTIEESDDEVIVTESKKVNASDKKTCDSLDQDDEGLRQELRSVVREKRMLELDEKQAKIEKELTKRAKSRVKREIKIEAKWESINRE